MGRIQRKIKRRELGVKKRPITPLNLEIRTLKERGLKIDDIKSIRKLAKEGSEEIKGAKPYAIQELGKFGLTKTQAKRLIKLYKKA